MTQTQSLQNQLLQDAAQIWKNFSVARPTTNSAYRLHLHVSSQLERIYNRPENRKLAFKLQDFQALAGLDPLLGILELAIPVERLQPKFQLLLFKNLIQKAYINSGWAEHLKNLLPYIGRHIALSAKLKILDKLKGDIKKFPKALKTRRNAEKILFGILSSADNLKELQILLNTNQLSELLKQRAVSPKIRALIAVVEIGTQLRDLPLPTPLHKLATEPRINQRIEVLRLFLKVAGKIINSSVGLKDTWPHRQYRQWLRANTKYLESQLNFKSKDPNKLSRKIDLLNFMISKLEVEITSGLLFSHKVKNLGSGLCSAEIRWEKKDFTAIGRALSQFPERELHLTPRIFKVQLINAEKLFGLAESTALSLHWALFEKGNKLRFLMSGYLFHELGHILTVQHSDTPNRFSICPLSCKVKNPSGSQILFDSYLNLSSWRAIPRSYQSKIFKNPFDADSQIVEIEGIQYQTMLPVIYKGKIVTFTTYYAYPDEQIEPIIYYRDALAGLPSDRHSNYDPFEEWSEGFRQYLNNPLGLVRCAPLLAYYFELIFRKYADCSIREMATAPVTSEISIDLDEEYINLAKSFSANVLSNRVCVIPHQAHNQNL